MRKTASGLARRGILTAFVGLSCWFQAPAIEGLAQTPELKPGTDYSRAYLVGTSAGTLLGVNHKRGHWAAVVGAPEASFDSRCGGVVVTLAFDEGSVYEWDGADWSGNSRRSADQLTPLLPFRSGDVADSTKLDDGIRRVRDLSGTVGHLAAALPLLRQKRLRSNGLELKGGTVPQTVDVTINARK